MPGADAGRLPSAGSSGLLLAEKRSGCVLPVGCQGCFVDSGLTSLVSCGLGIFLSPARSTSSDKCCEDALASLSLSVAVLRAGVSAVHSAWQQLTWKMLWLHPTTPAGPPASPAPHTAGAGLYLEGTAAGAGVHTTVGIAGRLAPSDPPGRGRPQALHLREQVFFK